MDDHEAEVRRAVGLMWALLLRRLVGHVVELDDEGDPVAVPVVMAGWVDAPRPGWADGGIEPAPIPGVPAYRVWRTEDPESTPPV